MNKHTDTTTTPATPDTAETAAQDTDFTVDAPASDEDLSVVPFKRGPMTDINFGF